MAASESLTKLICRDQRRIEVVGATAFDANSRPASSTAAKCPFLTALRRSVEGKCNGRQECYVTGDDMNLNKHQCPGIGAVFVEVTCRQSDEPIGRFQICFILIVKPMIHFAILTFCRDSILCL